MTSQFVSTWYVLDNSSVQLPITAAADICVNWGDASIEGFSTTDVSHVYTDGTGTKIISISGGWFTWDACGAGATVQALVQGQLRDISECGGVLRLGNSGEQFEGCALMTWSAVDLVNMNNVTTLYNCFANCTSLATVPALDTSSVTTFTSMFNGTDVFDDARRPTLYSSVTGAWRLPDASYVDQVIPNVDVSALAGYTTRSVGDKYGIFKKSEPKPNVTSAVAKVEAATSGAKFDSAITGAKV